MPQPERYDALILGVPGFPHGALREAYCGSGAPLGRRFLPQHQMPPQQERDLERESRRSVVTRITPPNSAVYTGSKAGVDAITGVLARKLGPRKIRDALNAKDNFCFDRLIKGWRSRSVLDLRHKR